MKTLISSTVDSQDTSIPRVSVIIPSTCELARRTLIERAIDSALTQEGVAVEAILVVNGNRYDKGLYEALRRDTRLSVTYVEEGHVSRARLYGLKESSGEFFAFLDDDDEFLPLALRTRADALRSDSSIDVLVTNGFVRETSDVLTVHAEFEREIRENPGLSFFKNNWFASPASMFRRATVDDSFFDIPYRYFEWTYLFFLLLGSGKRMVYSSAVTYRKYEDNPLSVSKSREYYVSLSAFLPDLMNLPLPAELQRCIKRRYVASLNEVSTMFLADGDIRKAITYHVKCLVAGGWRYLPYTRHILLTYIRRSIAG